MMNNEIPLVRRLEEDTYSAEKVCNFAYNV